MAPNILVEPEASLQFKQGYKEGFEAGKSALRAELKTLLKSLPDKQVTNFSSSTYTNL